MSTSKRAKVRPSGASVASTPASRIWCVRMTEVTSAMPGAAASHPALRQFSTASAMGSNDSGRRELISIADYNRGQKARVSIYHLV